MRLFVALDLPPEEKETIRRAADPLRQAGLPLRWVDPQSIHLTLNFLGEVADEEVGAVADAVRRAAAGTPPFDLSVGGVGGFPTLRRPRVVWLGVDATPALQHLKQAVERELSPLGFEPEARAFHPHLTLGRLQAGGRPGDLGDLERLVPTILYRATLPVHEIVLMRSRLSPRGARYERIETAPLGVAAQ